MSWQDAVLAVGQAVFIVALVPALRSAEKPPRSTCFVTGSTLAVCSTALLSLELWWGGGTMAATALCWLVLGFQGRAADVAS